MASYNWELLPNWWICVAMGLGHVGPYCHVDRAIAQWDKGMFTSCHAQEKGIACFYKSWEAQWGMHGPVATSLLENPHLALTILSGLIHMSELSSQEFYRWIVNIGIPEYIVSALLLNHCPLVVLDCSTIYKADLGQSPTRYFIFLIGADMDLLSC